MDLMSSFGNRNRFYHGEFDTLRQLGILILKKTWNSILIWDCYFYW